MKQSKRRRGFTLVELVIVIAVIAILAAVLIPTFTSVIQKANMSADQQTVRNMNVALTAEEVAGNVPDGLAGAETILRSAGLNAPVDTASSGYAFYWIQKSGEQSVNRVVLVEMNGKNPVSIVYPADLAAKYEMAALTWFSLAPTTEACLHLVGYGYTYRPIALETGGSEFHLVICGKCHEVIVMDAPHDTDGADGACSKCGWKKETNSDTDPCAHAYGVGSYTANGDGTHTKVCKICNQPTQEDCTFDAAGRCVYCDYDQPVSTHRHVFEYTPQNNGTHNRRCTDSACPDNGAPATGLACTFEYRKDEGYYCIYCNAKAPEGFEPLGGTAGGVANGYYYKNNRLYTRRRELFNG